MQFGTAPKFNSVRAKRLARSLDRFRAGFIITGELHSLSIDCLLNISYVKEIPRHLRLLVRRATPNLLMLCRLPVFKGNIAFPPEHAQRKRTGREPSFSRPALATEARQGVHFDDRIQ